jgi:ArsR family transcriptional regulator
MTGKVALAVYNSRGELVETLGLAQPTVSHHLKVLYEAGLLDKERRGTWIYYCILPEKLAMLRDALS